MSTNVQKLLTYYPSEHSHEKSEHIHEKIFALCYVASRPDNLTSLPFAHKMMG
jgi:hypothetical protein